MESVFDPNKPGPMLPIVEQEDPKYLELRAKEKITEAQMCLGTGPKPNDLQLQQYQKHMTDAIALLGFARVIRGGVSESEAAPRP